MAATVQIPEQLFTDAPLTTRGNVPAYHDPQMTHGYAQYLPYQDAVKFSTPSPSVAVAAHELTHAYLGRVMKEKRGASSLETKMGLILEPVLMSERSLTLPESEHYDRLRSTRDKLQDSKIRLSEKVDAKLCALDEGMAYAVSKHYGEGVPEPIERGPEAEKSVMKMLPRGTVANAWPDGDVIFIKILGHNPNSRTKIGMSIGYLASAADIGREMRGAEDLIDQLGIDGARSFVKGKMQEGYLKGRVPSLPKESKKLRKERVAFFNSMDSFGGR